MASASPGPSGKRSYDMELNLVPFIDLLSCCIAFLMVVAVWTHTARIEAEQKAKSIQNTAHQAASQPLLTIDVTKEGYLVKDTSGAVLTIALKNQQFDLLTLTERLKAIRQEYPHMTQIKVNGHAQVMYKHFIAVLDRCQSLGFDHLAVSGNE